MVKDDKGMRHRLERVLERGGKVLVGGFADRILIGIIIGLLRKTTPLRCGEHIRDHIDIINWASDGDWQRWKRAAIKAGFTASVSDLINKDRVVGELKKYRPDLLSVILSVPEGSDWLDRQIKIMKEKMEMEQ